MSWKKNSKNLQTVFDDPHEVFNLTDRDRRVWCNWIAQRFTPQELGSSPTIWNVREILKNFMKRLLTAAGILGIFAVGSFPYFCSLQARAQDPYPTPEFPTPYFPTPEFPTPHAPLPEYPTPSYPTPDAPQ